MAPSNLYEQLRSVSSTIISIQYDDNEFVAFKIGQAEQGKFINSIEKGACLSFQVNYKIYTFNRKHFDQMSNRELNELCKQLGVDGRQLLS